ncbi:hypothetical protein MXB_3260, partial [Myxobolus squamalis]
MESENSENSIPAVLISAETLPTLDYTIPIKEEPISPIKLTPPVHFYGSSICNDMIRDYTNYNIAPPKRSQTLDPYANFSPQGFHQSYDTSSSYSYPSVPSFTNPQCPSFNPCKYVFENAIPNYFVPCNNDNMNSNQVLHNNHLKPLRNIGYEEHRRSKAKYSKNSETSLSISRTVIEEISSNISEHTLASNEGVMEIDMEASAVDLAKDQHGSRHIQQKIEGASESVISSMIVELTQDEHQLVLLVGDVFGNYVIQKLFDHGNEEHCLAIVNKIKGNILHLSVQMYGCRVVQKAIESGSKIIQEIIIEELGGHVLDCIKDQNGNHVIQKCIEKVDSRMLDFIIKETVNKIIENSVGSEDDIVFKMMKDAYANYVIQKMIDVLINDHDHDVFNNLVAKIRPHYPSLRKISYGKHIINKIDKIYAKLAHRNALTSPKIQYQGSDQSSTPIHKNSAYNMESTISPRVIYNQKQLSLKKHIKEEEGDLTVKVETCAI